MAVRLSITVIATVILFFLGSTLSHARIPLNLPVNGAINRQISSIFPDSDDVTTALRHPSEASHDDEAPVESTNEESNTNTVTVATVPLKFVRFRPINRRFPLKSTLPLRLCRHHYRHRLRNLRPWTRRVEIPYGDDMIPSSKRENSDFDPMRFHARQMQPRRSHRAEIPYGDDMILSSKGETRDFDPMMFQARQMQPRWVRRHRHYRHHHHEDVKDDHGSDTQNEVPRLAKKHEEFNKEQMSKKRFRHEEQEEQHERVNAMKPKEERGQENGFLKNFRKFLNQFEF